MAQMPKNAPVRECQPEIILIAMNISRIPCSQNFLWSKLSCHAIFFSFVAIKIISVWYSPTMIFAIIHCPQNYLCLVFCDQGVLSRSWPLKFTHDTIFLFNRPNEGLADKISPSGSW